MSVHKYVTVEPFIAQFENRHVVLDKMISLGLNGKLDFFIPLRNVVIIWLAVFGEHKDPCGYHETKGIEFFKITTESFERLATSKKDQASNLVQLDVPVEIRSDYDKYNPDYYTSELRIPSNQKGHIPPTIDTSGEQNLSVRDAFNNLRNNGAIGGNLDNFEWESIDDGKLATLLNYDISQLWVHRNQVEHIGKEHDLVAAGNVTRPEEDSYSDYRVIGRDDLLRALGYKSWSGVRDLCQRYGVEIRHTDSGEPYLMNSAVTMLNTKRRRRRK
jgi:hypothetical protein